MSSPTDSVEQGFNGGIMKLFDLIAILIPIRTYLHVVATDLIERTKFVDCNLPIQCISSDVISEIFENRVVYIDKLVIQRKQMLSTIKLFLKK